MQCSSDKHLNHSKRLSDLLVCDNIHHAVKLMLPLEGRCESNSEIISEVASVHCKNFGLGVKAEPRHFWGILFCLCADKWFPMSHLSCQIRKWSLNLGQVDFRRIPLWPGIMWQIGPSQHLWKMSKQNNVTGWVQRKGLLWRESVVDGSFFLARLWQKRQ